MIDLSLVRTQMPVGLYEASLESSLRGQTRRSHLMSRNGLAKRSYFTPNMMK